MSANTSIRTNRPLHWFAVLTAFVTFLLIGLGGLVTSHGAGMSVPDWPNTYGYNMFTFPISKWVGGIFYEHTHRLLASAVGLMTMILTIWLWLKDSRKWMHWLGVIAFFGVIAQGILGGLRVTMHMDSLGIFHATIAQIFLLLMCALAIFTSQFWAKLVASELKINVPSHLRTIVLATTILIFIQLIIAATMRHEHAGLAISDFPLAYGKVWPAMDADSVALYNQQRVEVTEQNPITAFQIGLQMAHRIVALAIAILIAACMWLVWRKLGGKDSLTKLAIFWFVLILAQIGLGAWTIWSNKAADVATLHVMVGALSLVTGALWCIIAFGRAASARQSESSVVFGAQPALAANK
ncbi:MAG: COX15/CtaA family protein [Limisphaerales bacterium]